MCLLPSKRQKGGLELSAPVYFPIQQLHEFSSPFPAGTAWGVGWGVKKQQEWAHASSLRTFNCFFFFLNICLNFARLVYNVFIFASHTKSFWEASSVQIMNK